MAGCLGRSGGGGVAGGLARRAAGLPGWLCLARPRAGGSPVALTGGGCRRVGWPRRLAAAGVLALPCPAPRCVICWRSFPLVPPAGWGVAGPAAVCGSLRSSWAPFVLMLGQFRLRLGLGRAGGGVWAPLFCLCAGLPYAGKMLY